MQALNTIQVAPEENMKRASLATMASLLNLTFLPLIGFIWLLFLHSKTLKNTIDHYYTTLGIKLNLTAAFALGAVTSLIIFLGGLESVWTWVYVISYFTIVHATFIIISVWAMTRSWSGQKFRN